MRDDDLSREEREALDAWTVPELPADLADRVLGAEPEEAKKPVRSRRWLALAAGAAAVFAVVWLTDRSATGSAAPSSRATLAIGDRATAVAEAGSALAWRVGGRGEAVVEQNRGNVFYRVERGGAFEVRVEDKRVRVLGTSFRVEVIQMNSKKAAVLGAAAGALVATTVVVTVYEGKVVTAAPGGEVTLEAGEGARMGATGAPKRFRPELSAAKRDRPADDAVVRAVVVEDAPVVPDDETPEALNRALTKANLENHHLREQLAKAKQDLAEAPEERKFFEPSEHQLQKMADDCLVSWDVVSTGPKPPTVPDDDVEKLNLAQGEREIVDRLLKASQDELKETIRQAYTAVTGDTNTGSLATEAMFAEITDKTPTESMRALFRRLSHERAGRMPAPPEGASTDPVEQMFRVLTSSGDRLEQAIAAELGPEQASAIRGEHNGWNNKSRSSYGCPK